VQVIVQPEAGAPASPIEIDVEIEDSASPVEFRAEIPSSRYFCRESQLDAEKPVPDSAAPAGADRRSRSPVLAFTAAVEVIRPEPAAAPNPRARLKPARVLCRHGQSTSL